MLEMTDIGVEDAVAYRVGGKITEEEMTSVLSIFKDKIHKGEKLVVYQEIENTGGAEFDIQSSISINSSNGFRFASSFSRFDQRP